MPRFHYTTDFSTVERLQLEPQELQILHHIRDQVAVRLSGLIACQDEVSLQRLLDHHYINLIPTPLCPTVVLGSSGRQHLGVPGQMVNPVRACNLIYQREGLHLLQNQGYHPRDPEGPHRWVLSPPPKPRQSLLIGKYMGGGYASLTLRKTIQYYRSTLAQLGGQFIVLHPRPHRLYALAEAEPSLTVFHFAGNPELPELP